MDTNYSDDLQEKIDIVDKTGKITGKSTRNLIYQDGLLHQSVNIVVVNEKGQIFIQRRGPKKILPLYRDISASEHVKHGEIDYLLDNPTVICELIH